MSPEQLLSHYDAARLWSASSGLDVDTAYARALAVRALRVARGEIPRGYKIGFTNRGIWPRYGVFAPIWGTVWDSTLSFCEGQGAVDLQGPPAAVCQPRLEPECVLGLRSTPAAATLDALFDSLDWVAPGFEIVQSHLPDWKFSAADTIADGALHARLLVGAKVPARSLAPNAPALEAVLAGAGVRLSRDGQQVDQGVGANVLDGPLHAMLHFLQALRACPGAPDLQPGDVITTGTWTDAWPVAAGERWMADFDAPLPPLAVDFT